jgi:hypothetical protein
VFLVAMTALGAALAGMFGHVLLISDILYTPKA